LRDWVSRLESRRDQAVALVGDHVYRIWRLYMTASIIEFEKGAVSLNQTLFAKSVEGRRTVPLSRADLYRS
jgi:cyclopropane-fatty-acyl-phospholipid synthase